MRIFILFYLLSEISEGSFEVMFYRDGILQRSSLLDELPMVYHGFSSRAGGRSTLPHTYSLNLSRGLGDPDEVVRENLDIFARAVSCGTYGGEATVTAHQIHSAKLRTLTRDNAGEGFDRPSGEDGDGFVTCDSGVMPIARAADCVPILLGGVREDGSPAVAAVHAGWRGTVAGIAAVAVRRLCEEGCAPSTLRVAIGAHIGFCCYEVGDDFFDEVRTLCGVEFAERHVRLPGGGGKRHADLTSMNVELLLSTGLTEAQLDISPDCTMCLSDVYYSHRATHGNRGVHGGGICVGGLRVG